MAVKKYFIITLFLPASLALISMRMVHTGMETKSEVEALHGISEGERLVSPGAYLIYSEFILKKGTQKVHQH